ncbi:hypothetical protein SAMN05216583_10469 [Selenomonas sp. KH1T6]|nr:hypothetical protein SAMN05216583_10469 [Selenomonas ruminantium]
MFFQDRKKMAQAFAYIWNRYISTREGGHYSEYETIRNNALLISAPNFK